MAGEFYTDIDFNLIPKADDDFATLDDNEAVKQSVKNIVMTILGEKLFDPQFGTMIRYLLFNLVDYGLVFRLERQIIYALYSHEPRIVETKVRVIFYPEYHVLLAHIDYRIIGLERSIEQDIILHRVR